MNNLFQNYSPSVWKYTENEQCDVMWRHMTSSGPIFKKKLGDDILDYYEYWHKILSQLEKQERNGEWIKNGPKNGIMTS